MTTGSLPRKSGSGRGEEPEVSMASWTVSPDTRKEAEPGPVTQETSVPVGAQKRYSGKTNRERHSRRTRPPSQTEGWGGWQERRERNWAWCCFSRSLHPVGRCSLTTWPWGLWSELGLSLGSALPQTWLEKGDPLYPIPRVHSGCQKASKSSIPSCLNGRKPMTERDDRQKVTLPNSFFLNQGIVDDGIVGWHHQLNVHESEQFSGDGEGQRSLVCCSPWDHKESDKT